MSVSPTDKTEVMALVRAALQSGGLASISLDEARRLADLAEREATAIGLPIVVAVADAEGAPVLFHRMAGSLPASIDIAVNKAFTAAAFRMPTHELGELAGPGKPLFGVEATNGGKVVLFGGGFPLQRGGARMGALGISGGTVDEDMAIAQRALDMFFRETGSPRNGG